MHLGIGMITVEPDRFSKKGYDQLVECIGIFALK